MRKDESWCDSRQKASQPHQRVPPAEKVPTQAEKDNLQAEAEAEKDNLQAEAEETSRGQAKMQEGGEEEGFPRQEVPAQEAQAEEKASAQAEEKKVPTQEEKKVPTQEEKKDPTQEEKEEPAKEEAVQEDEGGSDPEEEEGFPQQGLLNSRRSRTRVTRCQKVEDCFLKGRINLKAYGWIVTPRRAEIKYLN